jgi:hypothetical protein
LTYDNCKQTVEQWCVISFVLVLCSCSTGKEERRRKKKEERKERKEERRKKKGKKKEEINSRIEFTSTERQQNQN